MYCKPKTIQLYHTALCSRLGVAVFSYIMSIKCYVKSLVLFFTQTDPHVQAHTHMLKHCFSYYVPPPLISSVNM